MASKESIRGPNLSIYLLIDTVKQLQPISG